jgi:hypothetical protein
MAEKGERRQSVETMGKVRPSCERFVRISTSDPFNDTQPSSIDRHCADFACLYSVFVFLYVCMCLFEYEKVPVTFRIGPDSRDVAWIWMTELPSNVKFPGMTRKMRGGSEAKFMKKTRSRQHETYSQYW